MPRSGKHPLKMVKTEFESPRPYITITTVIHIPDLSGYWTESLDVLRSFFDSLYASTDLPFDLMVFDNHSCSEVQDYLLDLYRAGKIQTLILSEYNLKKLGAMNHLFQLAKGDYVAFADSDVYFLPGWLEASLEILKTFPEAGQVSAIPTIDKTSHFLNSTHEGIHDDIGLVIETGNDLIPMQYIKAHCVSIGKEEEDYLKAASPRNDIRITRNNVSAYASAQDFQFITRREVIQKILPLHVRKKEDYYDPIYSPVFEAKVDELGYWRLSTSRYLVHHMGNHMPDLQTELAGIANVPYENRKSSSVLPLKKKPHWFTRILDSRIVRDFLKRIYAWSYSLLFER
jgi:glycosyltransferase involved in cell wall biosynthesis